MVVGKKRQSQVLIANAWHHRTDAVSSVVALLAIVGSMSGAPMLDPIAGLMVAGMVSLTGVQVREKCFAYIEYSVIQIFIAKRLIVYAYLSLLVYWL